MWVAMDPPTPDHPPQVGNLNIRNFMVRGEAALDRIVSGAPGQGLGGVQFSRIALRVHPRARTHGGARWSCARSGSRRDHRRADRLRQGRRASARHLRAVLRPQQHVRADSDRRPVPRRRQQRGPGRHHLRGERVRRARRASRSIRCPRSRRDCCASSSRRRTTWTAISSRRSGKLHLSPQRGEKEKPHTGFSSTCFFLPSESLITPSGVRSFSVSIIFSSVTVASLTLRPPALI